MPRSHSHSTQAITVLAHPLRSRLLLHLRTVEGATATELAAALGTNSGATSYHVRRLESVGLVRDTSDGRGRERVWAAADPPEHPDAAGNADDADAASAADADAALDWLERDYVRHVALKAEQWLDHADAWPAAWVDQLGLTDHVALVTREQLADLLADLESVFQRYRRVGQGNPSAKRIAVYTYAYPVDLANVPREATGTPHDGEPSDHADPGRR